MWACVAVVGLALDVVTKVIAVNQLEPGQPVRLVGGLLTLRLIRNAGAAFSQGEGFTAIFAMAAVLVLAFVAFRLVPKLGHAGWAVALGLLCAGVAGNLSDRIFRSPGCCAATWSTSCSYRTGRSSTSPTCASQRRR